MGLNMNIDDWIQLKVLFLYVIGLYDVCAVNKPNKFTESKYIFLIEKLVKMQFKSII